MRIGVPISVGNPSPSTDVEGGRTKAMAKQTLPMDHGPVVTDVEAKQARRGSRVFVVLVASVALVVIAFAVLYLASARPFTAHNPVSSQSPAPYTTP